MSETAYAPSARHDARLQHAYGDHVHILSDDWSLSMLARLGHQDTPTVAVHALLKQGFRHLLRAACEQLPLINAHVPTRMAEVQPEGVYTGRVLDPNHPVVVVDIARAGMIPGHELQSELLGVLHDASVRVDHVYMQRTADPDTGAVTGVSLAGSKIGGPVAGRTVFIPDPMAATGGSIAHVARWYAHDMDGPPRAIVALHLIVTPEYIRRITSEFPELHIYALRVDRGLSAQHALDALPGLHTDECGLNAQGYIVPGAGGLGEVINNSFV